MHRTTSTAVILIAAMTSLSACGLSDETSTTNDATTLLQLDGTVTATDAAGATFTITPKAKGEEDITFGYGPDVARGAVQALASTGTVARVYYRPTQDDPTAATVKEAPEYGEGVLDYTGPISNIDDERITIDGPKGERPFSIVDAEDDAFDLSHLKDHQGEGSSVKVYYRADGGGLLVGLGYEDA